ncbi:MAG: alpha/beta hydrolase [Pseudomonadota bacterium]
MISAGPDSAFAPLLADPRTALRPPDPDMPLATYRRRLDLPMAAVRGPDVHSVETIAPGEGGTGAALRVYRPTPDAAGTILFLHGGGFVIGSLETHDAMCRTLAMSSGLQVVAVDYRLAPEAPFPAARDDVRAGLRWVAARADGGPIALCGDSAGAHLAVRLAIDAADMGVRIAALGLLYPVADPACVGESWDRFGTGHVLTRDWMRWAWAAYRGDADPGAPNFTLRHADLSRLPPTRMILAECDPLVDEGQALVAAIVAAGGAVEATIAAGMIHGFASLPMLTPAANRALADLSQHFRQHMC